MSDRTKEYILKTLIVLSVVLMLLTFPFAFLFTIIAPKDFIALHEETITIVFYALFFTLMFTCFLFAILLPIFGGLKQKPTKAEKTSLSFSSYGDLTVFLSTVLPQKGYRWNKTIPISLDHEVRLYAKSVRERHLECFVIIRAPEISDEVLYKANETITNILTEYYGTNIISDFINMICVFCVDRITPAFRTLVDSNVQQGFKNGRLPIGISFGGKAMYIATQKGGFAAAKYKKMRKIFFDIMQTSI